MKSNVNVTDVICFILTIVFVVLKLLNKITWSWLWVLSPIWINLILFIILFLFYFIKYFTRR